MLESLRAVPAYGGTTLEGFDLCSYRWFADHELDPKPLDPLPDAIVQGGLMHDVLERLYGEQPGGSPLPAPETLAAWQERGLELVDELADERARRHARRAGDPPRRSSACSAASSPTKRAATPATSSRGCWRRSFGEDEEAERPALEIDGWRLHGAIDRVDLAPDGRALVHDYKVASQGLAGGEARGGRRNCSSSST